MENNEDYQLALADSLKSDVWRGEEAKRLINNPLLNGAFVNVKEDLIKTWEESGLNDFETRESIWREAKLLKQLKTKIETHIQTGEIAKANLERTGLLEKIAKALF